MKKIGFIGGGMMAYALAKGFTDEINADTIYVSDINTSRLELFSELGINTTTSNAEVAEVCDIVILAVKPIVLKKVLFDLKVDSSKLYISIVAGAEVDYIKGFFREDIKLIRVMPNITARFGCGITFICKDDDTKATKTVSVLFNTLGAVDIIDEKMIDSAMALTSCSPAFMFTMLEAMADAGVKLGFPHENAYKYAAAVMEGCGKMALSMNKHPAELRNGVCSPGGATIEGVLALEKSGFRSAVQDAVITCADKFK